MFIIWLKILVWRVQGWLYQGVNFYTICNRDLIFSFSKVYLIHSKSMFFVWNEFNYYILLSAPNSLNWRSFGFTLLSSSKGIEGGRGGICDVPLGSSLPCMCDGTPHYHPTRGPSVITCSPVGLSSYWRCLFILFVFLFDILLCKGQILRGFQLINQNLGKLWNIISQSYWIKLDTQSVYEIFELAQTLRRKVILRERPNNIKRWYEVEILRILHCSLPHLVYFILVFIFNTK